MKKSTLWIITLAAAVIVFAGVYALYKSLSKQYTPQNELIISQAKTTENKNQLQDKAPSDNDGNSTASSPSASDNNQSSPPPPNPDAAPDFTVKDENGNDVKLSDYFGKPIVLNFWATWCPYCIQEMPDFDKAYKQNPDVQFIMLNTGESIEKASEFIKEQGFTFPILYDTNSLAAYTYGATSLPTTFFIDKNGSLAAYFPGRMPKEVLEQGIDLITQ